MKTHQHVKRRQRQWFQPLCLVWAAAAILPACGDDPAITLSADDETSFRSGRLPENYRNYENTEVDRSRTRAPGQVFETELPGVKAGPAVDDLTDIAGGAETIEQLAGAVAGGEGLSGTLQNADALPELPPAQGSVGDEAIPEPPAEEEPEMDPPEEVEVEVVAEIEEDPEPVEIVTTEDVVDHCATAAAQTQTFRLVFEEKDESCAWKKNGNKSKKDGKVRARAEEYFNIALGEGDLLCDLSVSSPVQNLRFDDELFVTFNDLILLSSYNYNSHFDVVDPESEDLTHIYSWENLIGGFNPGKTSYDSTYCLGEGEEGSSCQVPNSQTTGAFSLMLSEEKGAMLGLSALEHGSADIGLIVTGDNDNSDCQHTEIVLDVSLTTVQL